MIHRTPLRVFMAALWFGMVSTALAAPPNITRVDIRGLQAGATTTLTIQGADLLPEPSLLFDIPIQQQQLLDGATAARIQFAVTLDGRAVPGIYNLRLANAKGVSAPVVVAADHLPQAVFTESIEALPVAFHSELTGSTIRKTTFAGKRAERVTIEVESQRLGARLRPVVRLYNEDRRQIAGSLPMPQLAGDTRLTATLPADGTYTVEVNDLQYAGASPGHFRLKVGSFEYADAVFPPAIARGQQASVELVGAISTAETSMSVAAGDIVPVLWPAGTKPSGPSPRILISDMKEVVANDAAESPQTINEIPSAISGRLAQPAEEDVFLLQVTAGDKLRFDLHADRIGSPIDGVLEIRNESGGRLAQNDDAVGSDPRLDYTVPKDVASVQIAVRDAYRRGGAECIYRLEVTRTEESSRPTFKLTVAADTFNVPPGESRLFPVKIDRRGYDGPIRLTVTGLPNGIETDSVDVPAQATGAIIALRNVNKTAVDVVPARIAIRGESKDRQPSIKQTAGLENHPLEKTQPWLSENLALAQAEPSPADFQVDWGELAGGLEFYPGIPLTLPIGFKRSPGNIGPIRLSVLTSQPPPVVNNRPDVNRAIRGEKATVDIAIDAKAKAALDALNAAEKVLADAKGKLPATGDADPALVKAVEDAQAKRDDAEKKLREEESRLANTGDFKLIIPPDLPVNEYDFALKAELRSVDNKTVLAEQYTTVRRFRALNPLVITLAGGTELKAPLDAKTGATVKLMGTVERLGGFAGDITMTIAGQPGGIAVPKATVKPDASEFTLELKIPANFAATEITTIKITASGPPDPKQTRILVTTELPITIQIEKTP